MVRETRHLWVGNLPENVREEKIIEHFKRSVACTSELNENALEVSDLTKLSSDKPETPWKQRRWMVAVLSTRDEMPCR